MLLQRINDPIRECLEVSGLAARPGQKIKVKDLLDKYGLSVEDAISELSVIVQQSSDPYLKQKILSDVLSMHGVKKDTEIKDVPSIVFQIQGDVQLNNILAPQRD